MEAVKAVFPVIFMMGLGMLARKKNIITADQNAGIKKMIFSILLPVLVFNAAFTMAVEAQYMRLMGYMFVLQCVTLALGFLLFRLIKSPYSHLSPYMMTTIEGGNAFYPLYVSLVGTSFTSYFVLLDIPCVFMVFLVIPLVLARVTSANTGAKEMLRSIYTNPVICALVAGILLNVTGAAGAFMKTPAAPVYEALVSTVTTPIAPLILFTLGYSISIGRDNLLPMIQTLIARLVMMACGVAIAFMLFPWILQDEALKIAVMLFSMCPPAFAYPIILDKLYRGEEDGSFCSTYTSLHMLVTVIIFVLIAVFMR